ncbi:serine/threonine-protein kinase [Dictyobacter aurantiacus]|uniref:non-specific serine/threonine protein kinase n=1 Tax=Dictyobacter aurantiacus TaxID=1936993 RepID=A0A401ZKZ1_9CHLR|nr:serine/threonine-protein kinase [Dictyobacter aurantiacus]GCE07516.1 hypothetical protein KDAU_48450 [Dictyobacter aurantiacus]
MKLLRYGIAVERLGQRYRLDGVLGSGGMADVCLAWDEREQREVAVKVIKSQELDQRTVDRFLKEASQVARWRHPHVVRIYGNARMELLDRSQGIFVPYIVMEYAQNGDLHKRLRKGIPFPFAQTLSVFEQVCQAVSFAHSQGVIHRDLKPLNILFRALPDGSEQALLSDFGLAVEKDATHFTFAAGGTLPYMAPEQLQGRAQPASDIFALGVILYQLCTGRLPFKRSLVDLRSRAPMQPPIPPSQLFELLPPDLDDVILQSLAEDPRQRYADALDFWGAVHEVVSASTVEAISRQQTLRYPPQPSRPSLPSAHSVWGHDLGEHSGAAPDALVSLDGASGYDLLLNSQPDTSPRSQADPATHTPARQQPNNDYKNSSRAGRIPRRTSRGPDTSAERPLVAPTRTRSSGAAASPASPLPPARRPAGPATAINQSMPPGQHRRRGRKLTTIGLLCSAALITALLLVLLTPIFPGLHALTGIPPLFGGAGGPTTPTITIVPTSKTITDTYIIQGVPANPDPQQLQISLRNVKSTPDPQMRQITGTGHNKTNGTVAKGTLTFFNGAFISQTIQAGTILTGQDGVQVTINNTTTIPPADAATAHTSNVAAAAHTINVGNNSNIKIRDINQTCCASNNTIFVSNLSPFTGGQDAADYTFVQQGDVDAVVNPLVTSLSQQAQSDFNKQLAATEQLVGAPTCTKSVQSNKGEIGDQGHNVTSTTVTVSATCTGMAYDQKGAQQIASSRLRQKAASNPGSGYALVGNVTSRVININRRGQNIALLVSAQGTWAYQFSPQRKQQLLQAVAGKSISAAQQFLKQQIGIANVFIHLKEGNSTALPTNPAGINIQIQDIQTPATARR